MTEQTEKPTKTIELPMQNVLVPKGSERLSVSVPEHEVRILEFMHPAGGVTVEDDNDPVVEDFDIDAGAELDRLKRKYNRTNAPNPVDAVYRNAKELTEFGFKLTGKTVEQAPKSDVQDHRRRASGAKKAAK